MTSTRTCTWSRSPSDVTRSAPRDTSSQTCESLPLAAHPGSSPSTRSTRPVQRSAATSAPRTRGDPRSGSDTRRPGASGFDGSRSSSGTPIRAGSRGPALPRERSAGLLELRVMGERRVIDMHTHPMLLESQQMFDAPHPPEDYLEQIRGLGIVRAAALVMAPRDDLELTRELNDRVLELATRFESFFYPVCSVHPADGEQALAELRRVADLGARWLKLHPITQDFDVADPLVTSVVREASRCGIPVLFDAYCPWDPAQPGKFIQLAREVPDARLILAHAHGPNFVDLLAHEILSRFSWWPRRVWFDISAT